MAYNPEKHHRRSIRLKDYDYSKEGIYFITMCVRDRFHLLGDIKNGKMELNEFGKIAEEEWLKSVEIRGNISLGEYVIMPNHIHGIIQINFSKGKNNHTGEFRSPSQTIGAIIRGFKGAATKRIKIALKNWGTGESQFAPSYPRQESKFAPASPRHESQFNSSYPRNESQFDSSSNKSDSAPIGSPRESQFSSIDLTKSIWQRDYYDIIIRNNRAYQNISNYILNNPANWKEDNFY